KQTRLPSAIFQAFAGSESLIRFLLWFRRSNKEAVEWFLAATPRHTFRGTLSVPAAFLGQALTAATRQTRLDKETIMKRMLSYACAPGMAISGLGFAARALAMPASAMKTEVSSNLVDVQHRRGYYRRGPDVYYNGHRGSRERRPGWRRHN